MITSKFTIIGAEGGKIFGGFFKWTFIRLWRIHWKKEKYREKYCDICKSILDSPPDSF